MVFLYCYCKNYGTKIHLFLELYAPNGYLFLLLRYATDELFFVYVETQNLCNWKKCITFAAE